MNCNKRVKFGKVVENLSENAFQRCNFERFRCLIPVSSAHAFDFTVLKIVKNTKTTSEI